MSRLKPVFKCTHENDKEKFKRSKCLLTISVGQEVHEAQHFESTVQLVNDSFESCIMLIDDSLQRHSMALGHTQSADDFYQRSIIAGDQWLQRNAVYYEKLTILEKYVRWDHWLQHPSFAIQLTKLKKFMASNALYQNVFTNTVDEFLRRYCQRITSNANFKIERAKQLCLDYLLEECTALCLWPELGCQFEVYPSRRNLAMSDTHQRFVLPQYPDLLHPVAIKFKNRKQFKPQQLIAADERTGREIETA